MQLFERSEFCIFSHTFFGMGELDSRQARSRGERFLAYFFFGEKKYGNIIKIVNLEKMFKLIKNLLPIRIINPISRLWCLFEMTHLIPAMIISRTEALLRIFDNGTALKTPLFIKPVNVMIGRNKKIVFLIFMFAQDQLAILNIIKMISLHQRLRRSCL
jgi:hypothetical protein